MLNFDLDSDFEVQRIVEEQEWKQGDSWKAFAVVQVRSDGSLDQGGDGGGGGSGGGGGGGGNGEKDPTGAPCCQAPVLSRPCHQSVLTNSQYMEACPHFGGLCWGLLFQEAFRRQCQSCAVFPKLCAVFCTARAHT